MKRNIKVSNQHSKISTKTKKLKALSFFSGAMGLDIGLHKAGINTFLCCEIDNASRKTILENNPEIGLIGDIRDYTVDDILEYAGLDSFEEVDLIVGGPPCQAFSTAGRRMGFEDERGNVFLKYLEVIEKIKPQYAVIENVRGLLSSKLAIELSKDEKNLIAKGAETISGSALYYVKKRLEKAGYFVSFTLYNSANFGTPQSRERVIITCSLKSKMPYLTPTHSNEETYKLPAWKTFKDAVVGVSVSECEAMKFPEKRLRYFKLLKDGQNWRNLPPDIQKEAMGKSYELRGGKTGFYRRLAWDKPAPTLVTSPAMPATALCHPTEDRPLSVEEYKRVQEFPDDWKICGSTIQKYKQIGNAVPVSVGQAIGKMIIKHKKGKPIKEFKNFRYSRYKNTDDIAFEKEFDSKVLKEQKVLTLFD